MSEEEISLDEWQLALKAKKKELQECQDKHQTDSCFKCEEVLECKLRDEYVQAVYDSMNKGSGGGFEF
jgi:hypothetical protein